jgi:hypothetical protein
MATGLSLYFYTHRLSREIAGTRTSGQPAQAAVPMDQALKDLEKAIASLQSSYADKKPQLDPELVAELDRNLAVTRIAIHECKQALYKNPGNNQAAEFLVLDYRKQIDILKQITEGL